MNTKKQINLLALLLLISYSVKAQQIGSSPVMIPMLLSANFGELRNNHFHAGLDIKIQGKIGEPLYSFDDGYISRIFVSQSGYGNALYITHPGTGYTTVYGHMDRFFDEAKEYVEKYQYKNEIFRVDLYLSKNEIPVKKGQYIGTGGNSGSSSGPHLHFEVRDTKTEDALNPLPFLENHLTDTRAPIIQDIMILPVEGLGMVNNSHYKKIFPLVKDKKTGTRSMNNEIHVWGQIGFAVKSYDYMDKVSNIFGPYSISLSIDGKTIYENRMDRIPFAETRYLNSFIDYSSWRKSSAFFMKSYIEPGNKLHIYPNPIYNGIINITQERDYKMTYRLSDYFGNTTTFDFVIRGREQDITTPNRSNTIEMAYDKNNKYATEDVELLIPSGNLYTNIHFKHGIKNTMDFFSPIYTLHDYYEDPLHDYCPLKIKVDERNLRDISKYFIARITKSNGKIFCKSEYKNGWFETKIRDFGDYAVVSDYTPPVITPVQKTKWGTNGRINCKISDRDSGIKTFKAKIDGKFYLLNYDAKNALLTAKLDSNRIQKGKEHSFYLIVTDNCDNETEYSTSFVW